MQGWIGPVDVDGAGWFVRHRYALAGTLLTVLVASQNRNQQWTKDIWLHGGVVAEFARAPFSPSDPILGGVGPPSQQLAPNGDWLSPYGWVAGGVAHLTGAAPLTVLSVMAILNTALLVLTLWWFVVTFTANRRAPFYALLAILLVWGPGAWRWSGFIHLDALGYVASYPSTFALAVLLATLVAVAKLLDRAGAEPWTWQQSTAWAVAVATGTWLIVLCHPPTSAGLVVGVFAVGVSRPRWPSPARFGWLLAALIAGASATLTWPWIGVLHLDVSDEIRVSTALFYEEPFRRLAPALLGLPIIVLRTRSFPRDLLGLILIGMAGIFAIGWLTYHDELGRTIAIVAVVLHVALGDGLGRLEAKWSTDRSLPWAGWALVGTTVVAMALGVAFLRTGVLRMAPREVWPAAVAADARTEAPGDDLAIVRAVVPDGSTVLAPADLSKYLPAFGAKVVASPILAGKNLDEVDRRRSDASAFFATSSSTAVREDVLERYGPAFVVLDRDVVPQPVAVELSALGLVEVAHNDRLSILAVPPS